MLKIEDDFLTKIAFKGKQAEPVKPDPALALKLEQQALQLQQLQDLIAEVRNKAEPLPEESVAPRPPMTAVIRRDGNGLIKTMRLGDIMATVTRDADNRMLSIQVQEMP